MAWVFIALGSAAIGALINTFGKVVMFRYASSAGILPFMVGLFNCIIGLALVVTFLRPDTSNLHSIGWALFSGILEGMGGMLLLRMAYYLEVTRVTPIYYTFPIFAALLAVLFLDEQIALYHWLAILSTVVGAVMLSVRRNQKYTSLFLHPSIFVLAIGSALAGSAHVTGKIALNDMALVNVHSLRIIGMGSALLLTSLRPEVIREFRDLVRLRSPAVGIVVMNEVVFTTGAFLLALWALALGPVALVATIISTRSFFVLAYSTGLSLRFKGVIGEETSASAISVKLMSTALIVAGIAIIAFN